MRVDTESHSVMPAHKSSINDARILEKSRPIVKFDARIRSRLSSTLTSYAFSDASVRFFIEHPTGS